jgi:ubiquinone/menaquinone biosynthesis C-methylase UbiE
MSLYNRYLLPRLIDLVMRNEDMSRFRQRRVPAARGVVLEIGIGSGLNLPFYSSAVTRLYGVDPSPELLALARRRAAGLRFDVELLEQESDRLPVADNAIDTVVMTWSLCSIRDPRAALREMSRVLKPGGRLIFVEHGLAPDPGVRAWQNRLTPLWRRIAGGCHLDRKVDDLIREAGFAIAELQTGYLSGPKFATFTYEGSAVR